MIKINMRSAADSVKGQGVGSAYEEQVALVKEKLSGYSVSVNAKGGGFDIIHFHTVNFRYFLERFFYGRKSAAVGYVHFLPDTLDDSLKLPWLYRKVFDKYLLSFYNSMDYLVTVNPSIVKKIADYGISRPVVRCIPNFVSEKNFFRLNDVERAILREKYEIPAGKFVVTGAGQLQTRKGIFDFIETAKALPDTVFIWAGGFSFGKISDGYEKIKKVVDNPPPNVKFLGIIDRSEMNAVYNMSDMFFLPSFDELFPMTILEAMCVGLPLLLRDIDVYRGILADAYLKGGNAADFAEKIESLRSDAKLAELWREKSFACHKLYNEENTAAMWNDAYAEALAVFAEKSGKTLVRNEKISEE